MNFLESTKTIIKSILMFISPGYKKLVQIQKENEVIKRGLKEVNKLFETESREFDKKINNSNNAILSEFKIIEKKLIESQQGIEKNKKLTNEVLWAQIFNDTIVKSIWLNDRTFSPGRWAAGYPYLYVLYRVLDEMKPQKILELGLGQTTKMIAQYAGSRAVEHFVVEHDKSWLSFFCSKYQLPTQSKVIILDTYLRFFYEDEQVTAYKDFQGMVPKKKFNLISVDGPFGYSAKVYARVDIIEIIPECLSDSFIVIIDDYNRKGEQNMVKKLLNKLEEFGISYHTGIYGGEKALIVITSEDLGYFCSM